MSGTRSGLGPGGFHVGGGPGTGELSSEQVWTVPQWSHGTPPHVNRHMNMTNPHLQTTWWAGIINVILFVGLNKSDCEEFCLRLYQHEHLFFFNTDIITVIAKLKQLRKCRQNQ